MPIKFPAVPEKVRAYVYRVVLGALAVSAFKGWIELDEVAVWAAFAATVLAVANTSTKAG